MSRDVQILGNAGDAPQTYTVSNAELIRPLAINATFDGTSAVSTFVPTVEIVSPGGIVIARVPADGVAAGGSAEVTFAPFLGSRSGSGGGDQDWALAGTGTQTNLAAGSGVVSVFELNTNAPAIFEVVDLGVSTTFVDANDAIFQQDRWGFNAFQVRNAALDTQNADAWSVPGGASWSSNITLGFAGELVYAFVSKNYIRGMNCAAPFVKLYTDELPGLPFTAQYLAASASGQGAGVVTFSAGNADAHVLDDNLDTIMVGLKPDGGVPAQIALSSVTYSGTDTADAVLPPALVSGDLVLLALAIRNGNAPPSIATPSGWTLIAASPSRLADPLAGIIDLFIYVHVAGVNDNYVLQINETGVYEITGAVQADDAGGAGALEATIAVSAGGTASTWDGANYIVDAVTGGAVNHWRANETKLVEVLTTPVQVTLSVNNRTGGVLSAWEGGIYARRLSDAIGASSWDV